MISIERYHDICMGHRVYGHEGKCKHLHGHNYRITFYLRPKMGLDSVGRVLDFSVVKSVLCEFLEREWDHKMMLWEEDPIAIPLKDANTMQFEHDHGAIVCVSFNPTAENIAIHLLHNIGPMLLGAHDCYLYKVKVEETRKCSAVAELDPSDVMNLDKMAPWNKDDAPNPYARCQYGGNCKCMMENADPGNCAGLGDDLPF